MVFFKVTDDEGNGESENENEEENEDTDEDEESVENNEKSQVKLSPRIPIKNDENRTQRKLNEDETDTLTNEIIKLVESKLKHFRNRTVQHNIRSKIVKQLSSKSENTMSSSLLCEIRKKKAAFCLVLLFYHHHNRKTK